jgi:hypothetical protein
MVHRSRHIQLVLSFDRTCDRCRCQQTHTLTLRANSSKTASIVAMVAEIYWLFWPCPNYTGRPAGGCLDILLSVRSGMPSLVPSHPIPVSLLSLPLDSSQPTSFHSLLKPLVLFLPCTPRVSRKPIDLDSVPDDHYARQTVRSVRVYDVAHVFVVDIHMKEPCCSSIYWLPSGRCSRLVRGDRSRASERMIPFPLDLCLDFNL